LVNTCKIPEKHIYFKKESAEYQLYPRDKIYLSRYAICMMTNNLLLESKSFKNDLSSQLFLSPAEKNKDKEKFNFESEMRTVFAGYYFAHPETDFEDLVNITWTWVRGKRLKLAYDNTMKDFEYIFRGVYGKKFNYHKLEEFKQTFIFDILFKQFGNLNFKQQYEKALESFGYKLGSNNADEIKWRKRHKVAPKYPGGFFAPQITFILLWTIKKFCEFEQEEFKSEIKDRITWFENLTKNFFSSIKEGFYVEKIKHNKTDYDFRKSAIFVNQHHSEANKIVNSIKNGSSQKITDKESGEKIHENPSALEFWKQKHLFPEDEVICMNFRKRAENELKKLHEEYKIMPSSELAKKICEKEKNIRDENVAIYGTNFQAFVNVPETVGLDGKFIPRPMFGPEKALTNFHISKSGLIETAPEIGKDPMAGQYKIDFDNPPKYEIKTVYLNLNKLPNFEILPEDKIIIPNGIPFAANPETQKRYYSEVGEFESINPLLQNPPLLSKRGLPTPADANFGFCSFLFEMDYLPLNEQIKLSKHLVSLNVINRIVFSGGKSLHMRCTVKDTPANKNEYRWLFFYLAEKYNLVTKTYNNKMKEYTYSSDILDFSCNNNGRATRRPGVLRKETKKLQELMHRTNSVIDINWREDYKSYAEEMKQRELEIAAYRASFLNNTGPNTKLIEKVKLFLTDWHDGNRHNLLDQGLIPMMWYAGWTENEIKSALSVEKNNKNLQGTINRYIKNVHVKTL
jgi:hypothetical protein